MTAMEVNTMVSVWWKYLTVMTQGKFFIEMAPFDIVYPPQVLVAQAEHGLFHVISTFSDISVPQNPKITRKSPSSVQKDGVRWSLLPTCQLLYPNYLN